MQSQLLDHSRQPTTAPSWTFIADLSKRKQAIVRKTFGGHTTVKLEKFEREPKGPGLDLRLTKKAKYPEYQELRKSRQAFLKAQRCLTLIGHSQAQ